METVMVQGQFACLCAVALSYLVIAGVAWSAMRECARMARELRQLRISQALIDLYIVRAKGAAPAGLEWSQTLRELRRSGEEPVPEPAVPAKEGSEGVRITSTFK